MIQQRLMLMCIPLTLFVSSSAFAATPTVTETPSAIAITCPVEDFTNPPILKVQRRSVANGGLIKESIVTSSHPGVTVDGDTFTFPVSSQGSNQILGHLPGEYTIVCHRPDHELLDATFHGELK